MRTIGIGQSLVDRRRSLILDPIELVDHLLAFMHVRSILSRDVRTLQQVRAPRRRMVHYASRHQRQLAASTSMFHKSRKGKKKRAMSAAVAFQRAVANATTLGISAPFARALPIWTPEMRAKAREDWAKGREVLRIKAEQDRLDQTRRAAATKAAKVSRRKRT